MSENTLKLIPIGQLRNKKYVIESYQRGYKWAKKEIIELLNDINNYDDSQGLYCLQPLILQQLGTEKISFSDELKDVEVFKENEVVDGQQRITTLYLILKYLVYKGWQDESILYEIDFRTRTRSGEFLKHHLDIVYKLDLTTITDQDISSNNFENVDNVNILWKDFVSDYPTYDNVDIYHFYIVTCCMIRWIEDNLREDKSRDIFVAKLLKRVKVIWYYLESFESKEKIIKIFLNNNKGKISLTSSELIKALLVLNIKNREADSISQIQINQFALEWDAVEKQLQDDRFWFFIQPDHSKYKEGTRIDYLFDLELNKPAKSDDLFAYREIEKLFNEETDITKSWEDLLKLFYKLVNWYEDLEVYHYVGFLINSKIKNLYQLIKETKGKNKSDLISNLKLYIKQELSRTSKDKDTQKAFFRYALDNLHYENFYNETLKVLLLHNVLYYLENMAGYKFPFELFVKEKWSIEHIIPQNPKDIDDIKILHQWYIDVLAYSSSSLENEFVTEILNYSTITELNRNKELLQKLQKIEKESEEIKHCLNNLLLLDRNTNSSLGNKMFALKRKKILEFDRNGFNDNGKPVFIPIETLNAFNKVYSDAINIENWTKEDGDKYGEAIKDRLILFLPTE